MGKLTGKTALITGASKGIGEGIARTFLKHGAKVILAARGAAVEELAAQLGENAMAVRMDVSDPASVKAGVEAAQAAFGPIDILVSNAGICKLVHYSSGSVKSDFIISLQHSNRTFFFFYYKSSRIGKITVFFIILS